MKKILSVIICCVLALCAVATPANINSQASNTNLKSNEVFKAVETFDNYPGGVFTFITHGGTAGGHGNFAVNKSDALNDGENAEYLQFDVKNPANKPLELFYVKFKFYAGGYERPIKAGEKFYFCENGSQKWTEDIISSSTTYYGATDCLKVPSRFEGSVRIPMTSFIGNNPANDAYIFDSNNVDVMEVYMHVPNPDSNSYKITLDNFGYVSFPQVKLEKGDINEDFRINANDLVYGYKALLTPEKIDETSIENVDLNGDGKVDIIDVVILKKIFISKDNAGNSPSDNETKTFYVEEYGAKGDGITDDGLAIADCVRDACRDDSQFKIIKFRPNATYRIKSVPQANKGYKSVLQIINSYNITVEGNNTTLLMKAPWCVATVKDSFNVVIKGLNVDYDPKPFAVGTVTSVNAFSNNPNITFKCDYDLGFTGTKTAPNSDYFAFRNRKDERLHYFIKKMTRNSNNSYTFYFNDSNRVNMARIGEEFILPVYGNSHLSHGIISLTNNRNIKFEDILINAVPDFGVGARHNSGKMIFRNFKYKPADNSKVYLTSWRDGFHIKDNTAKILWDNCYIGPLGDDAINLSSVTLTVNNYNRGTRTLVASPDEGICKVDGLNPGEEVIIYDNSNNKLIGYAKIEKASQNGNGLSLKIDTDLPIKNGNKLGIYRYNKNFVVKDSYIEGTVRVRSTGTFDNCKFNVFWVRVENDIGIEGPIPKDVLFKGCEFRTPYIGNQYIFHVGTNTNTGAAGQYKCKNIVLDGCKFVNGRYYCQPGNELIIR